MYGDKPLVFHLFDDLIPDEVCRQGRTTDREVYAVAKPP